MKLVTVFGTRPEIIRLSRVIPHLDRFCQQVLVYTGQNSDPNLSDVFFRDLGLRKPDLHLGVQAANFPEQAGQILERTGKALTELQPDRLLILGDTNSGLAAIVAARVGIPVYHMEAGNRCYDDRVPEEINRRIIDHCSSVLMPYTHRSKEHLIREGIDRRRIFVIGNPIFEVLNAYTEGIEGSTVLRDLNVAPGQYLLQGLAGAGDRYALPVIISLHPRTADRMARGGLRSPSERLRLLPPLGFFDFVSLERNARCVLTDSGTVQEECCIFRVPNVTLRDVTERAETQECGSNILSGADPGAICAATEVVLASPTAWSPPPEYLESQVSATVARIVLGYREGGCTSSS